MSRTIASLTVLLMALAGRVDGQDLTAMSGQWQGTLKGRAEVRLILRIVTDGFGGWRALVNRVDQDADSGAVTSASSVSLDGSDFKLTIAGPGVTYEGTLSAPAIPPAYAAIQAGVRKFTDIRSPTLSIVAIP